jgi:hypothetical protein
MIRQLHQPSNNLSHALLNVSVQEDAKAANGGTTKASTNDDTAKASKDELACLC